MRSASGCGARWSMPRSPGERTRRRSSAARSEVRLVGDRDVIVEMRIVFGADLLGQRLLDAPIALDRRPRLVKGVGILDADQHFELLAAIDQPPPLDDVEL